MPKKMEWPQVVIWTNINPSLDHVHQDIKVRGTLEGNLLITAISVINYGFWQAFRFKVPAKTKRVRVDISGKGPVITYTLATRYMEEYPHRVLEFTPLQEDEIQE
jgi:hypothetical protein